MLIFELIKNKLINIFKMINPACAGKTPSIYIYIQMTVLISVQESGLGGA